MLPAKGIVPIRRNRRERSHAAHGRLGALWLEEHEKRHQRTSALAGGVQVFLVSKFPRTLHSVSFRLEAEVVPVETLSVRCWCTVLPPLIPSSCFLTLSPAVVFHRSTRPLLATPNFSTNTSPAASAAPGCVGRRGLLRGLASAITIRTGLR